DPHAPVGHVHEPHLAAVVVAAEEVVVGVGDHVGGGHQDVLPPVQPVAGDLLPGGGGERALAAGRVVQVVVRPVSHRVGAHRPLGVVGDHRHVGGEERLV